MTARCYSTKQNAVGNCVAEGSLVYHTEPQIKKKQKNRRYETKNCCDISAGPKKQTPTVLTIFIRHQVA